jgi:anti-sigma factor RsiW
MADGAANISEHAACERSANAAAYLDGELDPAASADFEGHAKSCAACSAALLEQRRLLCLLDTAFGDSFDRGIELPSGFARELKARAQTDMSGVRARDERRRALKICAALSVAAFALLGATFFDAVLRPLAGAARTAGSVAGLAGSAAADAGAGAGLVLRAVGGRLLASSEPLLVLQAAGFLGAAGLLLRLIVSYRRSRAGE